MGGFIGDGFGRWGLERTGLDGWVLRGRGLEALNLDGMRFVSVPFHGHRNHEAY